jgi:cyclophilin family peptidyl-prolyl cis-trans isomerase
MTKKRYKRREQRQRARKGPPPRPARKPAPPNTWQRLRANRPLFYGLAALAVLLVVGLVWGGTRLLGRRNTPAAGPTPGAAFSWSAPPEMSIDPSKRYSATIVTDKGEITLDLFAAQAPKTVNNFVFLARQGYYDGVTFHRVIEGFMAQTGDRTGTGGGGPGYRFEDEIHPDLKHDGPGVLSMANSGPNTNGSQFFITYDAQPHLDGKHTIFGRVTAGMEVVESLTLRDPLKNPDAPPGDVIRTIRITES